MAVFLVYVRDMASANILDCICDHQNGLHTSGHRKRHIKNKMWWFLHIFIWTQCHGTVDSFDINISFFVDSSTTLVLFMIHDQHFLSFLTQFVTTVSMYYKSSCSYSRFFKTLSYHLMYWYSRSSCLWLQSNSTDKNTTKRPPLFEVPSL